MWKFRVCAIILVDWSKLEPLGNQKWCYAFAKNSAHKVWIRIIQIRLYLLLCSKNLFQSLYTHVRLRQLSQTSPLYSLAPFAQRRLGWFSLLDNQSSADHRWCLKPCGITGKYWREWRCAVSPASYTIAYLTGGSNELFSRTPPWVTYAPSQHLQCVDPPH